MINKVSCTQQNTVFQARYKLKKNKGLIKQPVVKTLISGWSTGVSTMSFLNHFGSHLIS